MQAGDLGQPTGVDAISVSESSKEVEMSKIGAGSHIAATATTQGKLAKPPAYRWWILFMNMIAYGMVFVAIQSTNAFYAQIQSGWNLSATEIALITTAFMATYAFTGGVGGMLTSKLGPKKTALIGLGILIVTSALIPVFGQTYAGLIVMRVLQGISGGVMATPCVTSTVMWFPIKQRALANGILLGMLGFGLSVATLIAIPLLAAGFDWIVGVALITMIPSIVIFVLYVLTVRELGTVYPGHQTIAELLPDQEVAKADDSDLPRNLSEARKLSRYWAACIFGFTNGWLAFGFSAFLPTLLTVDMGIDPATASSMIGATFIVTVFSAPLGGIVSDRVFKGSRYQTLIIGFALVVAGLVALPVVPSSMITPVLMVAYGAVSFCLGPFWTIPTELGTPEAAADINGRVTIAACIGNLCTGFLLSLAIDATGTGFAALWICVAIAAIGIVAAFVIKR